VREIDALSATVWWGVQVRQSVCTLHSALHACRNLVQLCHKGMSGRGGDQGKSSNHFQTLRYMQTKWSPLRSCKFTPGERTPGIILEYFNVDKMSEVKTVYSAGNRNPCVQFARIQHLMCTLDSGRKWFWPIGRYFPGIRLK
jgi:hypothetical protein